MRPTLSELGEYDGTALMEFKTRKIVVYRIKNETTCTYEIDDTPPFLLNRQAWRSPWSAAPATSSASSTSRASGTDGSIPQASSTGILGIEGADPLSRKVRIIQLSIEESSEISDAATSQPPGHAADRTVTYPGCSHLTRLPGGPLSLGAQHPVRTGIGAAREDANVASGGTRVEIKGWRTSPDP
jgi:glutamyl-tRNA(Gln) amidotransferase subunit E